MTQFKYRARDENGTLFENVIVADTETIARGLLAEKDLWILDIFSQKEKKNTFLDFELDGILQSFSSVSLRDMVIFCRQFSALVNSGVAMMRTLSILADQTENPKFKKILN